MGLEKKLLIMGGDARYLEAIHILADQGLEIFLIGYEQRTFKQQNVQKVDLNNSIYRNVDAVLLPVGGTDLSGKVEATYSDSAIYLQKDKLLQTPAHCNIFTGAANRYLEEITKQTNRKLVKIFQREEVAIFNSIPTAEGALHLAIQETKSTIHGSNVMILGFGRVGVTLGRLFSSVGANVHVAVRKQAAAARVAEMGMHPIRIDDVKQQIKNIDVCLNTVPSFILDAPVISNMKKECVIIDLASAPGGTDFTFARKRNIKAIHALGLPGKTAPKTAGMIIGKAVYELVENT